jgi:tetratricopeptide (TPR) repeat protein
MDDLSRVNNVTIRATTSSFSLSTQTVASSLNATHLLAGSIETSERGLELTLRVFDAKEQKAVFARRAPLAMSRFSVQRRQLIDAIISDLGIDGVAPQLSQPATSENAYRNLLTAQALLQYDGYEQLQQARTLMETTSADNADFPEAIATLAEAYARLGKLGRATDEAIEYAIGIGQQAARNAPSEPIVLRALATALVAGNKFDQARTIVDRALEIAPQMAELHRLSAELSLVENDEEAALTSLSTLVMLDPNNPRTFFVNGLHAHLLGDNMEAARFYEAAIEAGGNRSYILSEYLTAAWLRGTNRDAGVRYHLALADARPNDYRAHYRLGRAYAEKLDSAQLSFRDGLQLTLQALNVDNNDKHALVYHALFLTRLGRFDAAITDLERVGEEQVTDPVILYRVANAYALQNKIEKALEFLSRAVDIRFSFGEILNPDFGALFDNPDFQRIVTRTSERSQ